MEQALLGLLGRQADLAVGAADGDGRITFTTPALERMLGQPVSTIVEQLIASLVVFDSTGQRRLDDAETPLVRAMAGETVTDEVVAVRRPDGRTVYLRCSASPLAGASGRRRGAIMLVHDVTAEWMALLKQSELRNRLVTTVNHELRTPLTKILGHAELVADAAHEHLSPEIATSIAAITRAGHDLALLAEKLTHLANLEAVTHLQPVASDLSGALQATVASHQDLARARGVKLALRAPPTLTATVDAALVTKAVSELLANGLSNAPPRSTVSVELHLLEEHVEIKVLDQGVGVPHHDRARLMQPFERGDPRHGADSSLGLGLAVVSAIAAAHGGALSLHDNAPRGLVARMSLRRHLG